MTLILIQIRNYTLFKQFIILNSVQSCLGYSTSLFDDELFLVEKISKLK